MEETRIYKNDVLKEIYFITTLAQQQEFVMRGFLASKSDYIGGIFDRYINKISESLLFNKIILPNISNGKKVEAINDFYFYNPGGDDVGVAPDLFGLKINDKDIPFVVYNKTWKAVDGTPQVEVKTYKSIDFMVTINKKYNDKYLALMESDFKVDYLLSFFDNSIFSDDLFNKLKMNNELFLVKGYENVISSPRKVQKNENNDIGSLKLLNIVDSNAFNDASTYCEPDVNVEYVKSIKMLEKCRYTKRSKLKLSTICYVTSGGLFRFNEHKKWYIGIKDNIPYKKQGKKKVWLRTLDFATENIDALRYVKINNKSIVLYATKDTTFNKESLKLGKYYKVEYEWFNRGSNSSGEFIMQKNIVDLFASKTEELVEKLRCIIEKN